MRVIFSLQLTVTANGLTEPIAPLDPAGQSKLIKPCPPKKRCIDLRVGDAFDYGGTRYQVHGIGAYREARNWLGELPADGYAVK